ncbi:hypothetical protein DFH09DRAFT_1355938 [Mycena vulgaris]|nr:hypothetical protein DFH09DRAFT_1355938 [Mycena vulgaris]
MARPAPLPDFEYVETYEGARRWIWPDTPSSAITEPAPLTKIIRTVTQDDRWLTTMGVGGDDPMGEPADADDVGDGLAEVRYIDLAGHPNLLEFNQLRMQETFHRAKATFIVRDEYKRFIQHALSLSLFDGLHPPLFRFLVTGQPGIGKSWTGKSFGAHYFLLYLLGSGKPVFWVQEDGTYYFNAHGVQRLRNLNSVSDFPDVHRALQESWVLIDADQEWMPSKKYAISPFVIWTSSPRDARWKYFSKAFSPSDRWFMKPWSTKEIAAAADRLGCTHNDVIARMVWCGPVARHLFLGEPPTVQQPGSDIDEALLGNPFAQPAHRVFLVAPAVVKDNSGRRLVREDFFAEFLIPAVAAKTFELAENRMGQLQQFLSRAFDVPSTWGVAGRLVEGLMHRSLSRGIQLPAVFGGSAVAATRELLGEADVFVPKGVSTAERPLYLRPLLPSFAAVDAMVATSPNQLGLLQTFLADTHSKDFGTMLNIIARLPNGSGVEVTALDDVVYCLVGSSAPRVQRLVRAASATLNTLQKLAEHDKKKFCDEVGVPTDVARARIRMFRVVGLTFDHQTGFRDVDA